MKDLISYSEKESYHAAENLLASKEMKETGFEVA